MKKCELCKTGDAVHGWTEGIRIELCGPCLKIAFRTPSDELMTKAGRLDEWKAAREVANAAQL